MKNYRNYTIFGGIALVFLLVMVIGAIQYSQPNIEPEATIAYGSNVCVTHSRGDKILMNECDSNLLYNNGKDIIKAILGTGANMGAIANISLCNASASCGTPVAAGSEGFTAYTNCGLPSKIGTYGSLNTGNWSMYNTFTSTCDNVNSTSTRLTNVTGGIFAGNTFTLVTLQTNDQLTINWTIWVE